MFPPAVYSRGCRHDNKVATLTQWTRQGE